MFSSPNKLNEAAGLGRSSAGSDTVRGGGVGAAPAGSVWKGEGCGDGAGEHAGGRGHEGSSNVPGS